MACAKVTCVTLFLLLGADEVVVLRVHWLFVFYGWQPDQQMTPATNSSPN